jgi:predicted CxxxxCH...CXXCH cytochrome family protein
VPGTVDAPGHLNGLPALVRLSGLAGNSGATPSYDGNNCANTYCHGGLGTWGGSHTAPSWTATDGSASACGSCHALVPPLPHPAVADWPIARLPEGCWLSGCHANLGDDYAFIDRMLHINGKVDLLAAP